ncbi:MAG: ferrous iron transporter B [Marinilabiliaceae bacterium]|nr:ferrous iron transporter B [Marinilabiliaceae bacterium]
MKILLIGNPNVGKSVVFNRLSGVDVISSNYAGTTVDVTRGYITINKFRHELIDVPGIYSTEPSCKAEEIAIDLISEGDVLINVVDATNLERSLNLTLQLIRYNKPIIIALNMIDEINHIGISINIDLLSKLLQVECIPVCAITGEGINHLVNKIPQSEPSNYAYTDKERWNEVGKILSQVQTVKYKHHSFAKTLRDASVKPITGIPFLVIVLMVMFLLIRVIGESLINYFFSPLFEKFWSPIMLYLSGLIQNNTFLHDLLIGKLSNGQIDYGDSFGLLTTGLYVPIGSVLPYVFAFYLVLSIMEDSGYLPRAAVMVDNIMHKMGLHGLAIIPMLLGLGCNVPGALSTRLLETRKEKFIASTLLSIAVPCMALQAMLFGMLGEYGIKGLGIVFVTLFLVWLIIGFLLRRIIKGTSPEIFLEIPPYRIPFFKGMFKKVFTRVRWFLKEAVPFVLLGVLIANLLYTSGILEIIARFTEPVFVYLLGLPKEASGALIMGFLRKDLAVGMLLPLSLSLRQLIVASVVLAMYFPCVATFSVLLKELGIKDMLKSTLVMLISTLIVGTVLNYILILLLN